MNKLDILEFYRKFIEKSRAFWVKLSALFCAIPERSKSLCVAFFAKLYIILKKLQSLCAKLRTEFRIKFSTILKRSKSLCAAFCAKLYIILKKLKSACARLKTEFSTKFSPILKKSKSFCIQFCTKYFAENRLNLFLLIAGIVVLAFITVNQMCRTVNQPKRTGITISSQCRELFGSDTINALIQEFEEQHPDLQILIMAQPAAQGTAQEMAQTADIVFFDDSEFSALLHDSALASLDPYIYTETQTGEQPAHWALPLVSFMDIFLYNIDILQTANSDRPPKTRVEFLAAARAVAEQESAFAFALGLSPADPSALRRDIYPWIWANGGELALVDNPDGNDAPPLLPREAADIIAFMGQLHREGLLAPETFEKTGQDRLEEFAQGKIAMMTISARDLVFLRRNARGVNFGITAMPAMAYGKNRLGLSNIYAGISSSCSIYDEAWTFLAFIAGKSGLLTEALEAVPGSFPNAFPGEYITKDPLYSKAWDIFEAADIAGNNPGQPPDEAINRLIREKLTEALEDTD